MLSRGDRRRDEQKLTMLEQVHHDADRVTRLVTELLDISRLETGRLVLRRTMVDLPALAATVTEKVQLAIPDRRRDVSFGSDVAGKTVVEGKRVLVRVERGGLSSIKKKR